ASYSGTSMATPHVSGVAALNKARFPAASAYTIKALLYGSVDPIASLNGKTITNGRLNAANAVSCTATPELLLSSPVAGFSASVGEQLEVKAIAGNCTCPAGAANVHVDVNGTPVTMTASSPDSGLYTGSFTPSAAGPLSLTASLTVGSSTVTRTASGSALVNYACNIVTDPFGDASSGDDLGAHADRRLAPVSLPFPFLLYGQPLTTLYVSSNGFISSGSAEADG